MWRAGCVFVVMALAVSVRAEDSLSLSLRYRQETSAGSGRFHTLLRNEEWKPQETVLILCDVWDSHHSHGAVVRVNELVPRLNAFTELARSRGVTVLHAPSNCMKFYEAHPARLRAQQVQAANAYPAEITEWCYKIPSEEQGTYPLDQSDGGCDDTPEEHAAWQVALKAQGRNEDIPWVRQHAGIRIDEERDFISDQGKEVWNILESRGIKNVIIAGVHTNMCVLGRPFGLRQMSRNGKSTVLLRDMTDTMYNPAMSPQVSHFTGTDLIVEHIEKWVCPTITSNQLLGGEEFRFHADQRPHVVVLCAEDEYETEVTLPQFAREVLGHDFRVSLVFGSDSQRNDVPGLSVLEEADVLLVSVRRRPLPTEQLAAVRKYVGSGKPVVGIRTASHAFCLRDKPAPEGLADWPEFDAQVFGGHYTNHHANDLRTTVIRSKEDPLLNGFPEEGFVSEGSLYMTSPLAAQCQVLLTGQVEGKPEEPVAWTFLRDDGGTSFYTSLGHKSDFTQPGFRQLLVNALKWIVTEQ